jgi:GNAT superfamily N-acetyltransferase
MASPRDSKALALVHSTAMKAAMPWLPAIHDLAETRDWMANEVLAKTQVCVADCDGAICGYASVSQGWLNHLYVSTEQQGQGVGSQLLEWTKQRSPSGFRFWTFQRNARARAFYEARGCRSVLFTDGAANEERMPDVMYFWKPSVS